MTGDDHVYLINFGVAHDAAATSITSIPPRFRQRHCGRWFYDYEIGNVR
ncbi:hypothetical protein [Mycobacterium sp. 23]